MNIRVAHVVNSTFGSIFSGQTHYLFSLLSGWSDKDITLDILGNQIKPLNMNSGDRNYFIPASTLWTNPSRGDRWEDIRWSFRLIGLLLKRRHDYEIVHFHRLSWGSLLSPIILHPFKKKVVFTMSLMGNDNPSYIWQQRRGQMQVALLCKFDGAIGLSPALVEDAKRNGIRNLLCLPNFLAIPQLEEDLREENEQIMRSEIRAKLGIPSRANVLLFVGSIIHRKGVDILIDAFINLAAKYSNLVLILVGPGSKKESDGINEDYVNQLKEKIITANLSERVFWEGMVKEQSILVDYYRSADIFVFPTRNEGLGNVLIEAMAARLPVVATRLQEITDIVVSEDISGYLVEPEKTEEFISAIDKFLQDDCLRKDMGAAGRRIAIEKFGFDAYCQKLKQFYLNLFSVDKQNHA